MNYRSLAILLLSTLIWLSVSCTDKKSAGGEDSAVIDMSREPSEVFLPKELWSEIERVHIGLHTQSYEKDRELTGSGLIKFYASLPLTVTLESTSEGVLKEKSYSLVYPDGGGTLDLARFVNNTGSGSITLRFDFPDEFASKPKKVFFLSGAPVRELDGKLFGSGCESFMDLTSFFENSMEEGGLRLFLKDQRHITAYGGTFFLVTTRASQLFLAHLKIKDSRYPKLLCPTIS